MKGPTRSGPPEAEGPTGLKAVVFLQAELSLLAAGEAVPSLA